MDLHIANRLQIGRRTRNHIFAHSYKQNYKPFGYKEEIKGRYRLRIRSFCKITDTEAWTEAKKVVRSIGISEDKAEDYVGQAFGWGSQKYWQKERVNATPDAAKVSHSPWFDMTVVQMEEVVEYLRSVGFRDEELAQLAESFPEFLGCDLNDTIRPNVEYLQNSFFLKGPTRVKAILRKPRVIGNVVDCAGDCQGRCTKCWSQF